MLSFTAFGLACDSAGNVYAAFTSGIGDAGEILRFAPDGTPDSSPFVGPANFPSTGPGPIGLAFDASGNLFVSTVNVNDTGTGDIRKFGPDGTEITPRFATGLTKNPRGLAFDSAGNLFLAEPGSGGTPIPGDILEFTPDGTKSTFASQNFGTRGNRGPEWLAFTTGAVTPPSSAVTLTLPDATTPLTATITSIDQNSVPPPPSNFVELSGSNLAFDISTTATPTPPIIIAFTVSVDPTTFSNLKALHYECDTQDPPNCQWQDRTIYPGDPNYPSSPAPNTIYGSVNSLSPFLIAMSRYSAQVQQPINADGSSVFRVKRRVVPVAFTLTFDGVATCQLPPATISVIRNGVTVLGVSGSSFRIDSTNCHYVYNLATRSLGAGTYTVNILIGGTVVGSVTFALK